MPNTRCREHIPGQPALPVYLALLFRGLSHAFRLNCYNVSETPQKYTAAIHSR